MRIEKYDYAYELTDEQLLYFSALPAIAKLRWLDEARRFTLMARQTMPAYERRGGTGERAAAQLREPGGRKPRS